MQGTGSMQQYSAGKVQIGPSGLSLVSEDQQLQLSLEPVSTVRHSIAGSSGSAHHYSLSPKSSVGTPTATVSVVPVPVTAVPDIEAPAPAGQQQQQTHLTADNFSTKRTTSWKIINYCIIPLALPLLVGWWLLALLLAAAATFSIWPSLLLARRLYWACPFIPYIFAKLQRERGWLARWLLQLQFEGAHCMTALARLLSLPLRPHLPDFYVLGFPVRSTRRRLGGMPLELGRSVAVTCWTTGALNDSVRDVLKHQRRIAKSCQQSVGWHLSVTTQQHDAVQSKIGWGAVWKALLRASCMLWWPTVYNKPRSALVLSILLIACVTTASLLRGLCRPDGLSLSTCLPLCLPACLPQPFSPCACRSVAPPAWPATCAPTQASAASAACQATRPSARRATSSGACWAGPPQPAQPCTAAFSPQY
eukprot:GHRQ01014068.1.p1 GENE.GHRQ01014068.1~~GHRQ01014068.1.p1  ORF type:complete len:420 (+),score=66.51 GHRQ01014068.1:481-1740(+)